MIPNANARGHSFKGITAYLLHDKGAETAERVAWSSTHNLPSNDIEQSSKLMAWMDSNQEFIKRSHGGSHAGRKAEAGNVYHFSLSWSPEEKPNREHMEKSALAAVKYQGLEEHQYYLVAHNDTDHAHVHIVANLVHPKTGRIHSLYNDYHAFDRWARDYERAHGIKCENREKKYQAWENNKQAFTEKDRKADYTQKATQAFRASDNAGSFQTALQEAGLTLAQGQKRGFTVVDERGKVYALNRLLTFEEGTKRKAINTEINQRLKGLDKTRLEQADTLAKERQDRQAEHLKKQTLEQGAKKAHNNSQNKTDSGNIKTQSQQSSAPDLRQHAANKTAAQEKGHMDDGSRTQSPPTTKPDLRKQWAQTLRDNASRQAPAPNPRTYSREVEEVRQQETLSKAAHQYAQDTTKKSPVQKNQSEPQKPTPQPEPTLTPQEQWAQRLREHAQAEQERAQYNAATAGIVADNANRQGSATEKTLNEKANFEEYVNRQRAEMQDFLFREQAEIENRQSRQKQNLEEQQRRRTEEHRKGFEAEQTRLEQALQAEGFKKILRNAKGATAKDQHALRMVQRTLATFKQRTDEEHQALTVKHTAETQRFNERKAQQWEMLEQSLQRQQQERQDKIQAQHQKNKAYRAPANDTQSVYQRGQPAPEQNNTKPARETFKHKAKASPQQDFKRAAQPQKQAQEQPSHEQSKPHAKAFESHTNTVVKQPQTFKANAEDLKRSSAKDITQDMPHQKTAAGRDFGKAAPTQERARDEDRAQEIERQKEAKAQEIARNILKKRERSKGLDRGR